MEYTIIIMLAIISLLLGFCLFYLIINNSNKTNSIDDSIRNLFDIQKGEWENKQLKLEGLFNPLNENLSKLKEHIRELEIKREGAYQSLGTELRQLASQQKELQDTTHDLKNALKSSTARGRWGEIKLKNIVKLSGMDQHVDFQEQTTTKTDEGSIRPDMLVNLPNGGIIVIDAKSPYKAFLESIEQDDPDTSKELLVKHAKATRTFMRSLSQKKYWEQFEGKSPDLVVMFIPIESALYAAFENDKNLFDDALENKILIVSAVSLLAILKAIYHGWMQLELDENTQKIADEGKEVYRRFMKFKLMFDDIGQKLKASMEAVNKAAGSMNSRVLPSMKRLKEMGAGSENIKKTELLDIDNEAEAGNKDE